MYDNRQVIFGGTASIAIPAYHIVAHATTAGQIKQAIATDTAIGVSSDTPAIINNRTDYVAHGPHRLRVGAAVTPGTWLKPDASGRGIPAAVGEAAIARAIQSGTTGDLVDVFVQPYKV
ncbi:MAG: hypothetical protein RLZZ511_4280 [Cyanobacteriota bacterium]|jgi:hypothetical protein